MKTAKLVVVFAMLYAVAAVTPGGSRRVRVLRPARNRPALRSTRTPTARRARRSAAAAWSASPTSARCTGTCRRRRRAGPSEASRRPCRSTSTSSPTGRRRAHQRADRDQIDVLNNTFAGGEGGADTGFSFRARRRDPYGQRGLVLRNPGGTNEHTMKQTLRQGGTDALNLYSTTAGDYLGWAYLPDIVTKPGQAYLDGVVIDWESIPGTSTTYAGRYDQGETATHEVGHWLNLEHTFFGGCNAKGDFVDDTPAQKMPTSGCPEGKDTCSGPGWTRSTTTWTTRTTPATRSSRRARPSGCGTPGCSTAPRARRHPVAARGRDASAALAGTVARMRTKRHRGLTLDRRVHPGDGGGRGRGGWSARGWVELTRVWRRGSAPAADGVTRVAARRRHRDARDRGGVARRVPRRGPASENAAVLNLFVSFGASFAARARGHSLDPPRRRRGRVAQRDDRPSPTSTTSCPGSCSCSLSGGASIGCATSHSTTGSRCRSAQAPP